MGSIFYEIAKLPMEERRARLQRVRQFYAPEDLMFDWRKSFARPEQIINYTDGNVLAETGRGWGKTRALCEHIREEVDAGRARSIGIIVPKYPHLRNVIWKCFQEIYPPTQVPTIKDGGRRFIFHNGAEMLGFSSEAMSNVRGNEFDLLIGDEVAYWEKPMDTFLDAIPALRKRGARWVCATTPPLDLEQVSALEFMDYLREHCNRHIVGGTLDNVFLPEEALSEMRSRLVEGTLRYKVEFLGEPVTQPEGALWDEEDLIVPDTMPKMRRVVIAVDVAGSVRETADDTGICVAGLGYDGNAYVIEDLSGKYLPSEWARVTNRAFKRHNARHIVIERNYGGDMVQTILQTAARDEENRHLPVHELHTTDSKFLRAEPVSVLYKQRRVFHAPGLDDLETQMLRFSPMNKGTAIDDRVDAMVYAITDLLIRKPNTQMYDLSARA